MKFTRIKGADRPHNIVRLPKLGHIRLGIKKIAEKSRKEYPAEVDYFVVPPEVQRKFGEKPKILPIMLPVEDEEMFLRQFYACYGSNQKVKCMGDGENAERRTDKGKESIPCPHPENCEYGKQNVCRARTIIQVVLPDINMGGVYQLSTGSINSDIDIRSGIEMAKTLFKRISWVPMIIEREEKKIPDPETGKMQNHWPVKMFPIATMEQTNQIREDTQRIIEHQKRFALPEPVIEGELDDTPIEIVQEETETEQPTDAPKTYEEKLLACQTIDEISAVWKEILDDPELKKKDKDTNARCKQLNILKKQRKTQLTSPIDLAVLEQTLKESETVEELQGYWNEAMPYLQGENLTKMMRIKDIRATELKGIPAEETVKEPF